MSKNNQHLLNILEKAKKVVKKDPAMIEAFKKYNVDINELDYYPIFFDDLEVSATTKQGIVYLNYKLLENNELDKKDYGYLIHEFTHVLQQTTGDSPTKSSDDENYLYNKNEQEGFQNQIDFIDRHFGEDESEEYVEDLLDHHEIDNKKEKNKLKNVLLSKTK